MAFITGADYTCTALAGVVDCDYAGPPLTTKALAPRLSFFIDTAIDNDTFHAVDVVVTAADDVDPGNDTDSLLLVALSRPINADLIVAVTPSATSLTEGDALTLDVRVRNIGQTQNPGNHVRVQFTSDFDYWYGDVSGDGWFCDAAMALIECEIYDTPVPSGGALPPISIVGRVGWAAPELRLRTYLEAGESSISAIYENDAPALVIPVAHGPAVDGLWASAAPNGYDAAQLFLRSRTEPGAHERAGKSGWNDGDAAASPDGHLITFVPSTFSVFNQGLWLATADGSDSWLLADDPDLQEASPSFSPDGRQIVFAESPTGPTQKTISIINIDGTGRTQIPTAATGLRAWSPCFAPDGSIGYASFWEEPQWMALTSGPRAKRSS